MNINFPERPNNSDTGENVLLAGPGSQNPTRDALIVETIISGNVPYFMHTMHEVDMSGKSKDGTSHLFQIWASHDYLCIGQDDTTEGRPGFVRTPLGGPAAQKIANFFSCTLPTRKMVNAIWNSSDCQLAPQPWGPPFDASMLSTRRVIDHNARIEAARAGVPGMVAGHKKDVILTNLLRPGRVAIYGWHKPDGSPIQGVNAVSHESTYADYSHGIRLISLTCVLDGQEHNIHDVMQDSNLCELVTDLGPAKVLGY